MGYIVFFNVSNGNDIQTIHGYNISINQIHSIQRVEMRKMYMIARLADQTYILTQRVWSYTVIYVDDLSISYEYFLKLDFESSWKTGTGFSPKWCHNAVIWAYSEI